MARVSDSLVGWSPGDLLWWLTSEHTAHVRSANLELNRLAYTNPDPMLRFPIIETIEVLGQLVFPRTVEVTRHTSAESSQYSYWGEKHLALEDGHLQHADETQFLKAKLSPFQREQAIDLVARTCDILKFQGTEWTKYAQAVHQGTWNFHPAIEAREEGRPLRNAGDATPNALTRFMDLSYPPSADVADAHQRELAALRQ